MAKKTDTTTISCPPARGRALDLGVLALRATTGGLLAGHGAQKLFGAFGGHGLEGTAGWLESIGFRPGKPWAIMAGASEFGGGALTALGLGGPLGPLALQGSMATAARRVHWGKPIWVTEGGAEVPALYSAIGLALAFGGPGRYSLDRMLGIKVPKLVSLMAAAGIAAGIWVGEQQRPEEEQTQASTSTSPAPEDQVLASEPSPADAAPSDPVWGAADSPVFQEPNTADAP